MGRENVFEFYGLFWWSTPFQRHGVIAGVEVETLYDKVMLFLDEAGNVPNSIYDVFGGTAKSLAGLRYDA